MSAIRGVRPAPQPYEAGLDPTAALYGSRFSPIPVRVSTAGASDVYPSSQSPSERRSGLPWPALPFYRYGMPFPIGGYRVHPLEMVWTLCPRLMSRSVLDRKFRIKAAQPCQFRPLLLRKKAALLWKIGPHARRQSTTPATRPAAAGCDRRDGRSQFRPVRHGRRGSSDWLAAWQRRSHRDQGQEAAYPG